MILLVNVGHFHFNVTYMLNTVCSANVRMATRHWGRVPSVHGMYYPASAWLIQLRAYAMPSVPVPPITLLTDVVARCRLLAAHGARSCLCIGEDPAAHGHWCTFTDLYHTIPYQPVMSSGWPCGMVWCGMVW